MNKRGQDEINKVIANFIKSERASALALIKDKMRKKRRELKVLTEELAEEKDELEQALQKVYSKKGNSFKKLTELSFVDKVKKNQNMIKVYTKDLIVDKTYDFGQYIITITNQNIKAYRFRGKASGYHHCFVNESGLICYGNPNVEKSIRDWRKLGLYHLAVAVIWDTLSNVPVGSKPYIGTKDFYSYIKEEK